MAEPQLSGPEPALSGIRRVIHQSLDRAEAALMPPSGPIPLASLVRASLRPTGGSGDHVREARIPRPAPARPSATVSDRPRRPTRTPGHGHRPPRTHAPVRRPSAGGVEKVTEYHHDRYEIVGHHLSRHPELDLLAIGLGVHIQSLPPGSPVDIKTLAARFPQGRRLIAAALRQLEDCGYLERARERTPDGRIVTRTTYYNHPEATRARRAGEPHVPERPGTGGKPERPAPGHLPAPMADTPHRPSRPTNAAPPPPPPAPPGHSPSSQPSVSEAPEAPSSAAPRTTLTNNGESPHPQADPPSALDDSRTSPGPAPSDFAPSMPFAPPEPPDTRPPTPPSTPAPAPPPRRASSPLPRPSTPDQDRADTATALLINLRHADRRLLLSERDVRRLAPAVAAWLERGAAPDAVRGVLITALPGDLRQPAALLGHRLTALLPPAPTPTPTPPAPSQPSGHPFDNCDMCDRAIRANGPKRCRDCREEHGDAPPVVVPHDEQSP
ncbi:hypothetical protein [Streptomyces sp. NPDC003077]|uniref:hypothetical protein n=1 Tax=Streptomyces sp. NPDC003077 TaxID=3154443 RepID=UPI0033BDB861